MSSTDQTQPPDSGAVTGEPTSTPETTTPLNPTEQPPPSSEPPPPQPPTSTTPPPTTTTSPEPPQPQPQQSQPQPQPLSTTSSLPTLPPYTPTPNPRHPTPPVSQPPLQPQPLNPMLRTPFSRPWQQNPPPFPHFSSITTAPTSSLTSIPPSQRGGMAIGVPAPQPPTSFSSLTPPSFASQFSGLNRSGPESTTTTTPQVRQSISGMMGSLGSGSSLRPGGVTGSNMQRPMQASHRPQTGGVSNQSGVSGSQNFQDHGLLRGPSVGSPGTPPPQTSSQQPHNQPWLSTSTTSTATTTAMSSQGKPPLAPPSSFRPQISPQSLQTRAHIPPPQQQQSSSNQPPSLQSSQPPSSPQEHYALPPSRVPQTLTHQQQQLARNRGLGNQRPFAPPGGGGGPPGVVVAPPPRVPAVVEAGESCNRIISKRSIHEIVAQIDPGERLDPEVEDILVDIADEFVESITTFACSLAKHRKSNTLDSKDILLHLEKNWNMSLPGFGGDEIKVYKKPFGNDVHRERLAVIKKSIAVAETPNLKSSGGQAGGGGGGSGGGKGHPAKAPGLVIGSPNPKGRETT